MYAIRSYYDIQSNAKNRPLTEREQMEVTFREKICKKAYTDAVKTYNKETKGRKIRTLAPLNITVITSYSIHYTKLYEAKIIALLPNNCKKSSSQITA